MSQNARVKSVEALKEFKAALCNFGVDAKDALCTTEVEIRRFFDWLERQQKYWVREVRQRQEEVVRAKAELTARKYSQRDGRGPGYTEQEIALEKAIQRLHEAEFKVERVQHWSRQLPRDVAEYEGPGRQLAGMLDADLGRALAILETKIDALDAYLKMTPPVAPSLAPAGGPPASASTPDGPLPSPAPAAEIADRAVDEKGAAGHDIVPEKISSAELAEHATGEWRPER